MHDMTLSQYFSGKRSDDTADISFDLILNPSQEIQHMTSTGCVEINPAQFYTKTKRDSTSEEELKLQQLQDKLQAESKRYRYLTNPMFKIPLYCYTNWK